MDESSDELSRPSSTLPLAEDEWGEAFDGHTEFQSMTFTQRLTWLSEAVVSVYMLAKCNPGAECNLLFER